MSGLASFYKPWALAAYAMLVTLGLLLDLVFAVSILKVVYFIRGLSGPAYASVLAPQIAGLAAMTVALLVSMGLMNEMRPRRAWGILIAAFPVLIVALPLVADLAMWIGGVSPDDFKSAALIGAETPPTPLVRPPLR